MREPIDLFVEQTMRGMDLDDEQRRKVAARLREYILEVIAATEERGAAHADAEAAVLKQLRAYFPPAEWFKLPEGWRGRLFEWILSIVTTVALIIAFKAPAGKRGLYFISTTLLFAGLHLLEQMESSVKVGRSVRVRRRYLSRTAVPLDRIKRVSITGSFSGSVAFDCDGGRVTIPLKTRGVRLAILALDALRPDAVDNEAYLEFSPHAITIYHETPKTQLALGLGWLVAAGLLVMAWHSIRALEGLTWWNGAYALTTLVLFIVQSSSQASPIRRGLTSLLSVGFVLSAITLGKAMTGGGGAYSRLALMAQPLILSLAALTLGWPRRQE